MSPEPKFTPGPWVFEDQGNHNLIGADGSIIIDTEWGTAIRNRMDARLIAAATDLYAALEGLNHTISGFTAVGTEDDEQIIRAQLVADAALAKARGEV